LIDWLGTGPKAKISNAGEGDPEDKSDERGGCLSVVHGECGFASLAEADAGESQTEHDRVA
jgi:hypothetical protein